MKKIYVVLLSICMLFVFASCSQKEKNEIANLYERGFTPTMTQYQENIWEGIFQIEDKYDAVYRVTANLTDAELKKLDAIEFSDEKADEKIRNVLEYVESVEILDVTDKVPTSEELDGYVGLTIKELEDLGFENSGYSESEGVYSFYYDGPVYSLIVDLMEGEMKGSMDDYSTNDLKELKIGKTEFLCFSEGIFE